MLCGNENDSLELRSPTPQEPIIYASPFPTHKNKTASANNPQPQQR